MSNRKLVPVDMFDLDDQQLDRLRMIQERTMQPRRMLDKYSHDQVCLEDIFPEQIELSERERALRDHAIKAWVGETLGERPQRRLDEYSDDSQVYIGDIFEDIVPDGVPEHEPG
jgi:hypothetical protein